MHILCFRLEELTSAGLQHQQGLAAIFLAATFLFVNSFFTAETAQTNVKQVSGISAHDSEDALRSIQVSHGAK